MIIFSKSKLLLALVGVAVLSGLAGGEQKSDLPETIPAFLGTPATSLKQGSLDRAAEIQRLWESHQERKAFGELKKWMKEDKESPFPWVLAAQLWYREGRYKKTISMGDAALGKSPKCAAAYYWRGRAFESLKKPLDAANEYRAALIAQPGFAQARQALDVVLVQLGSTASDVNQTFEIQNR
jgi:tetratricopeptide (TPR) repeat protein